MRRAHRPLPQPCELLDKRIVALRGGDIFDGTSGVHAEPFPTERAFQRNYSTGYSTLENDGSRPLCAVLPLAFSASATAK